MEKKKFKLGYLSLALLLILASALFFWLAKTASDNKEAKLIRTYQKEALVLYEKAQLLGGQERDSAIVKAVAKFTDIAYSVRREKLAAAALFNSGTIYLEEFKRNEEKTDYLKGAILYLQESLRKDPSLEKAQRNLEWAWGKVKEKNLADELGLSDGEGDEGKNGQGLDDGMGADGEPENGDPGNGNAEDPLPYEDEEGFGRGEERNDY